MFIPFSKINKLQKIFHHIPVSMGSFKLQVCNLHVDTLPSAVNLNRYDSRRNSGFIHKCKFPFGEFSISESHHCINCSCIRGFNNNFKKFGFSEF